MSHSYGRQESRSSQWQQRQREQSREKNQNRLERHPQGEHSGQDRDPVIESRSKNEPTQGYANPRPAAFEPDGPDGNVLYRNDSYNSRYGVRSRPGFGSNPGRNDENANREWVSGTGQAPYRIDRSTSNSQAPQGYRKPFEMRPSFAGRGPQGYKRSDDRITEDVNERMTRDHELDASGISVETKDGEVILQGTVSDRASRRRAEEIAESCSGVKDVLNQLRINRENKTGSVNKSTDNEAR